MFKVNNKDTRMTHWCNLVSLLLTLNIFHMEESLEKRQQLTKHDGAINYSFTGVLANSCS